MLSLTNDQWQRFVELVAHRDGVDVRLMAGEGLFADAVAHIPKLTRKKPLILGIFLLSNSSDNCKKFHIVLESRFWPLLKHRRHQKQRFCSQGSGWNIIYIGFQFKMVYIEGHQWVKNWIKAHLRDITSPVWPAYTATCWPGEDNSKHTLLSQS